MSNHKKINIAAAISTYADFHSLQRNIYSVLTQVDLIIVVYGRYHNFVFDYDEKKEEMHKFLAQYQNTILVDLDPASQVAKRNKYLEVASEYKIDILLVTDSDEWIEERKEDGGWEDFRKRAAEILQDEDEDGGLGYVYNLYGIFEQYGDSNQLQYNPRIIFRPEQCEYFEHHNWIRNKSRMYRLWMEPAFSKGIVLRGDNSLRTEEREKAMDAYEIFQSVCDEKYT